MDVCYPPGADWGCAYDEDEYAALDPAVVLRSEALAWSTLSALLGYRLSLCPSVLRPCMKSCSTQTWYVSPVYDGNFAGAPEGGAFAPFISDGSWYNGCGCVADCSCSSLCEIVMPTPVGGIESIWMDGVLLAPGTYRVDNGNRLVRTDGECWPSCQDMANSDRSMGGLFVSYYPYLAPNDLLRYAAGVLAAEYYKSCTNKQCRLPQGVTSITRTGITMEVPSGLFPNGATGLREVDPIIRIYNPNGLKVPARVLSPDVARGRVQTWVG